MSKGLASGKLETGTVIAGRYRIGGLVGSGGTGIIHDAKDLRAGKRVAVKTLNADVLSHPSAVARYHREARAAGAIGHPNICAVTDVGQLKDERPYLIMELLVGQTLSARIRHQGPLPLSEVLSIMTQTLAALDAAHSKKFVHRDIKPDNIFLSEGPRETTRVKLLDFGIAKSLDEDAELSLTRTGMVVGTPYYMAPEQACGHALDHRVDLYGCGLLLFEMLTGERPYRAKNYKQLMLQILTEPPPDPRELRPGIPAQVIALVRRGMAKRVEDRYPNARSFLEDIQDLQDRFETALSPDEIARIRQRGGTPAHGQPAVSESEISADIPVYLDTDSVSDVMEYPEVEDGYDDETVRAPFNVPEDQADKTTSLFPPSEEEQTDVMDDLPWDQDGTRPDHDDDDPTEVAPHPFAPGSGDRLRDNRVPRPSRPVKKPPPPDRNR